MFGLFIIEAARALGNLCLSILKYALVLAVLLSPYAIDAAIDKWLENTLPPTESHE